MLLAIVANSSQNRIQHRQQLHTARCCTMLMFVDGREQLTLNAAALLPTSRNSIVITDASFAV